MNLLMLQNNSSNLTINNLILQICLFIFLIFFSVCHCIAVMSFIMFKKHFYIFSRYKQ